MSFQRNRRSWIGRQRQMDGSVSLREVVEAATMGTRRRLTTVERLLRDLDAKAAWQGAEVERLSQIIAELERTIALAALRGRKQG